MEEILQRACKKSGVRYSEFLSEIRKAQRLCKMEKMSEAEFIKTLTLMALREYPLGEYPLGEYPLGEYPLGEYPLREYLNDE